MEKTFVKTFDYETSRDLKLLYTGKADCGSLHSFGPAVRPNYLIHIVIKGQGRFHIDEKKYEVKAGHGFIIPPDKLTFYQADRINPWSYYWLGFTGALAPAYLQGLGLDTKHPIFKANALDKIVSVIEKTFKYDRHSVTSELMLSSLLYEFLALLQQEESAVVKKNKALNPHIQDTIDFVKDNYSTSITVQSIAESLSLNRSYLSSIFKAEMGVTLQQYITEYRLTRAAELLSVTNFSIDDIAEFSGYADTLVFSKAFKRRYEITPSQYRKNERNKQKSFNEKDVNFTID